MIKSGNNIINGGELMNNLSTLLEYLVEDMNEAAKSVREAISEKLAVYASDENIILYNPQAALNNINDNIKRELEYKAKFPKIRIPAEDVISFEDAIVGIVTAEPNDYCGDNTYEVRYSAALSGYGPLLYDLVLSHIYPGFLVSDRGSVSPQAQKVWNFYFNNRPDVNKQLITSIYDPQLDDKCRMPEEMYRRYPNLYKFIDAVDRLAIELDDAIYQDQNPQTIAKLQSQLDKAKQKAQQYFSNMPIAYRYQIKSPKGLTALKNNHTRFLQSIMAIVPKKLIDKNPYLKNVTEDVLVQEAEDFFNVMFFR